MRIAFLVFNFLKTGEALHVQFLSGTLEADTWHAWENIFAVYAKSPGFASFWSQRAEVFTPAFRALYESWPEDGGPRADRVVQAMISNETKVSENRDR